MTSPFEEVGNLITSVDEEVEVENKFMVNRILSYQSDTFFASTVLNRYLSRIPDWATNSLFNNLIKKRRQKPYFNYPKKSKKRDVKLTKKICETFCAKESDAKKIIELLRLMKIRPESYFGLKDGE